MTPFDRRAEGARSDARKAAVGPPEPATATLSRCAVRPARMTREPRATPGESGAFAASGTPGLAVDDRTDERIDGGERLRQGSVEAVAAGDRGGCRIAHQRLIPVL